MAEAKKTVASSKQKVTSGKAKPETKKKIAPAKAAEKKVVAKSRTPAKKVVDKPAIKAEVKEPAENQEIQVQDDVVVAKAGKRSSKAVKEAEEKAEKEARKTQTESEELTEKPKKIHKPARSRLERRSKKFREVAKLIDKSKEYSVKDAMELVGKTSTTKFDATVELHVNLGVDPKQADQNIRGTVILPSGSGKTVKVAVMAEADDVAKAKKAGADIAGVEEITNLLDKEALDFDILIATPSQMPKLGKYARLLGPRGLMPNPKSGTVTADVAKAVSEAKAGKVEYRVDSTGIVHLGTGKVSFGAAKLEQNINAILANIKSAKPSSVKGIYLKSAYVTTTMGPSMRLALSGEA